MIMKMPRILSLLIVILLVLAFLKSTFIFMYVSTFISAFILMPGHFLNGTYQLQKENLSFARVTTLSMKRNKEHFGSA